MDITNFRPASITLAVGCEPVIRANANFTNRRIIRCRLHCRVWDAGPYLGTASEASYVVSIEAKHRLGRSWERAVPDVDHTATAISSAGAAITATIAMKAAASESDMSHIIAP